MTLKLRKRLIVTVSILMVLIACVFVLPYILKDKIIDKAKLELNKKLEAKVDFKDVDLSFFRSFPYASIQFSDFYIVGNDEFKRDTLLFSENVDLTININSLFGDNGYDIRKLQFNNSKLKIIVLSNNKANWDIVKKDSSDTESTKLSFHWKLKEFAVKNADISFFYEKSDMLYVLKNVNHATTGDLFADSSLLITKTTCDSLSYTWGAIKYISNAKASIDADINADLNNMKFSFSKNSSEINDIVFSFEGWLKSVPNAWDMDIKLNAPQVDFKDILSMIPALYSESFANIETGGEVKMSGFAKGLLVDDFYPAFNFKLSAENAWFKYPDLPKKLQNINVNAEISNPGKSLDETVIDISNFSFLFDTNPCVAKLFIQNPVNDTKFDLQAVAKIDLGAVKDLIPLDGNTKLNGLIDLNVDVHTLYSAIEKNDYKNIKFAGTFIVSNLIAKHATLKHDFEINKADFVFNNQAVRMKALQMKIDSNDLSASGNIQNFIPYVLQNTTLSGQLNLFSNYLNVNDIMPVDENKTDSVSNLKTKTVLQIPSNIAFNIKAKVNKLVYEKMSFENCDGSLSIANSKLNLQNMQLDGFGGSLMLNGLYDATDVSKPAMNMKLSIVNVLFKDIFAQVESLQKLVPIFNKASGRFSTDLQFNSLLNNDMTPNLMSVVGNGKLLSKTVGLTDVPAIEKIAETLNKDDLLPMAIKDLALLFEIADGKIVTKPFYFKVKDVGFTIGGTTGLDKSIAYNGNVQLPDKLKLGKFSNFNMTIGGTFSKPKVQIDLKNTLTEVLNETLKTVEKEVTAKVDEAKEKALDEARKQKELAMKNAQEKAQTMLAEAKTQGDKLIAEAQKQADALIAKATNPITKYAAELAAKKIIAEAQKKADEINLKAQIEADKVIEKVSEKTDF